jgi:hypothetical protein
MKGRLEAKATNAHAGGVAIFLGCHVVHVVQLSVIFQPLHGHSTAVAGEEMP